MQETITVANVKCGGCAQAIRESLSQISGVTSVDVVIENGCVSVQGEELQRDSLTTALQEIGYPEITTT